VFLRWELIGFVLKIWRKVDRSGYSLCCIYIDASALMLREVSHKKS